VSLKTLICVIMLLCDSICIGYGHVLLVWIRCHLIVLGCLSLYTFVSYVVLEPVLLVQSGAVVPYSATVASTRVHDLSYASHIFFLDTMCNTPQVAWM
jgi:hypothetical protein